MRTISSYLKLAGAVAVAGVVVAAAIAFVAPKAYISSSVIRTAPGQNGADNPELSDRMNQIWGEAISRSSLSEIIQNPQLNLYSHERMRKPIEDVIEDMRRDLRIDVLQVDGNPQFRVSFTYPDRYKAQLVVEALTRRMLGLDDNCAFHCAPARPREEFRLMTHATLPDVPLKPDRLAFVIWGLGVGLVAGIVAYFIRWRAKWTLKVLACGLAGCAAAAALSFLIPNRYTSQSQLRILLPPGKDGVGRYLKDGELAGWLHRREGDVLSDASLAEISQRPSLDLYPKQREQMPLKWVLAEMRRNLVVKANSRSIIGISFTYPNQYKAQLVVNALSTKLVDSTMEYNPEVRKTNQTIADCAGKAGDEYIECVKSLLSPAISFGTSTSAGTRMVRHANREQIDMLDAASLPETPVAPDRRVLAAAGLFLGLFLGAWTLRNGQAMRLTSAGMTLLFTVGLGQAQTGTTVRPEFDVASIKAAGADANNSKPHFGCLDGGRFVSMGVPLKIIIEWAYDIRTGFSLPDIGSSDERYQIEAKAAGPMGPAEWKVQCRAMTRSLLEDRFKLKLHRASKEMPVYALVVGKNGSKLRFVKDGDGATDGVWLRGQKTSTKGWELWMLASTLGTLNTIGRPVVDRTGLEGLFEFRLDYAVRPDEDRPNIFTAVQEQLGLKLEAARAPVEVVVIDHVEKPSEN
jgi:uncharacterized protein (TIGR03435 family)